MSEVVAAVRRRAGEWLAGSGPVDVVELSVDRRTYAEVHFLRLQRGATACEVVVKLPVAGPERRPGERTLERPRMSSPVSPDQRRRLEHDALRMIAADPAIARAPDLRALRVMGEVEDLGAVVVERVDGPTLRELTNRAVLRPGTPAGLVAAYRSTGRWLRAYHGMTPAGAPHVVRPGRADAVALVEELCTYLASTTRHGTALRMLACDAAEAAALVLPDDLPLGLRHDDCAPRNFLVTGNGVVALDILARLRAPVFEDLGCFVSWLRSDLLVLASRGVLGRPGLRTALERAFLEGYFGEEEIPIAAVRFYELVTTLDRWSAWVADGRGDVLVRRRLHGSLRRLVGSAPLRRRAATLVRRLQQPDPGGGPSPRR